MRKTLHYAALVVSLADCGSNDAQPLPATADDAAHRADVGPSAPDAGTPEIGPGPADGTPADATPADPDATAPVPDRHIPDASPPPVQTGGRIAVKCPASGFHQPGPVEIASLPGQLLPRCSPATKQCTANAVSSAAYDACLAADATPPATFDGADVDCLQCERTQGAYCLASACISEFSAFACCAQKHSSTAPCQAQFTAVTQCAGAQGRAKYEHCIGSLVPLCFP